MSQFIVTGSEVAMVAADCFVCATRTLFDPLHLCDPIKRYCQHSKNSSYLKPTITISKATLVMSTILITGLLFPIIATMPLLADLCVSDKSTCLVIIGDVVFLICSFVHGLILLLGVRPLCQQSLGFSEIIKNRHIYGFTTIITKGGAKIFVTARTIYAALNYAMVAVMVVIYYLHPYDYVKWKTSREVAVTITIILECYIGIEMYTKLCLVGVILEAVKTTIAEAQNFGKCARLIIAVNSNLKLSMDVLVVTMATWIISTIINLICHIAADFYRRDLDFFAEVMLQGKTMYAIFGCVVLYYIHDKNLKEKVSQKNDNTFAS